MDNVKDEPEDAANRVEPAVAVFSDLPRRAQEDFVVFLLRLRKEDEDYADRDISTFGKNVSPPQLLGGTILVMRNKDSRTSTLSGFLLGATSAFSAPSTSTAPTFRAITSAFGDLITKESRPAFAIRRPGKECEAAPRWIESSQQVCTRMAVQRALLAVVPLVLFLAGCRLHPDYDHIILSYAEDTSN
jgi:hypothetical protein